MHYRYDLSLVLACYNEAETFTRSIKEIIAVLDKTDWTYEIILVDDKSTDQTVQLIHQIVQAYPRKHISAYFHPHRLGRGATVSEGFLKAKGRIVGYIDIDLEIPAWYIPRFIESLNRHVDAAIGHRIYDLNFKSFLRWLSSKGYIWVRQQLLNLPLTDTESGYKFFKRDKILPIVKACRDTHWFWDTEIVARSLKHGLRFREIPVVFIKRADKTSTVRLLPDTLDYLRQLWRYRHELKFTP